MASIPAANMPPGYRSGPGGSGNHQPLRSRLPTALSAYQNPPSNRNNRLEEMKRNARNLREEQTGVSKKSKPADAPVFKCSQKDKADPLADDIANSLGDFGQFLRYKAPYGEPLTPPMPPGLNIDPEVFAYSCRSAGDRPMRERAVPTRFDTSWQTKQKRSRSVDPRINTNCPKYAMIQDNTVSKGRPPQVVPTPPAKSNGNVKLGPEQKRAVAQRADAHRETTKASRSSPPVRCPAPNSALSISQMEARFDVPVPHSVITPMKAVPRKSAPRHSVTKSNERRTLLPNPEPAANVMQPQWHVPPPPQPNYVSCLDLSVISDPSPVKTNKRDISEICAGYPSGIDLSEEDSEEEGELREHPAIPTQEKVTANLLDDDLHMSDDDSSKSTSDSSSSGSGDSSASSGEEKCDPKSEDDKFTSKPSWNLSQLFQDEKPVNAPSKDVPESSNTRSLSLQRSPRRTPRMPVSDIESEDFSDSDIQPHNTKPQVTPSLRQVGHSRQENSSDSDEPIRQPKPAPQQGKKDNKRSLSKTVDKIKNLPSAKRTKTTQSANSTLVGPTASLPPQKPAKRGRPRKVLDVNPESKMKSKQFISTDDDTDSDTEKDMNKRPIYTKKCPNRSIPPRKSPKGSSPHSRNKTITTAEAPSENNITWVPKLTFNFFTPKPASATMPSVKKIETHTTANTADINKKKCLALLVRKPLGNQHDLTSGKGKPSTKHSLDEKSLDAPPAKRSRKEIEVEKKSTTAKRPRETSVVETNRNKKEKLDDTPKNKSTNKGTEVVGTPTTTSNGLQNKVPSAPSSPNISKKSHRRGGTDSRCNTPGTTRTPQHDSDRGRTTPAPPVAAAEEPHDNRVPFNGEPHVAYQSRQFAAVTPTTDRSIVDPTIVTTNNYQSFSNPNRSDTVEQRPVQPADSANYPLTDVQSMSTTSASNSIPRNTSIPYHLPQKEITWPTPTRYGGFLPANVASLYPTIAELDCKPMGEIFEVLFGTNANLINYENNKQFVQQAITLKRKADNLDSVHTNVIGTYYIEAVIYFIIAVHAMESEDQGVGSAITMSSGTMNVVTWLFSLIKKKSTHQMHAAYKGKLEVFCLFCQSILSLKVYNLRKDDLRGATPFLADYFNQRIIVVANEKNAANNSNGGVVGVRGTNPPASATTIQNANSPSTQSTPSPVDSLNSDSSGYNTSNCLNTTPSPPQPNVESDALKHNYTHFSITSYLQSAYQTWNEALELIVSNNLGVFFGYLDRAVTPLSITSSTIDLVCYIKAGLREINVNLDRNRGHQIERPLSRQNDRPSSRQSERPPSRQNDLQAIHPSERNGLHHRGHGGSPSDPPASGIAAGSSRKTSDY